MIAGQAADKTTVMRVLIADDDPVGRQMMATAIELLGHDVTQVTDGQEAVDAFVGLRCELLVLDWMMPKLDGLAVARHIRAMVEGSLVRTEDLDDPAKKSITNPMILLATAFDDPHVVAAALEAGVDDYMIKPVNMAEIRARIAVAVERYRLRQATIQRELELRRQRAHAEAISQARARFLANMSHELRTPLNGMIGMSDYLLSRELSEPEQEASEIIRASALSLAVIIDDILDLTQVDEGRVHIELRPFDARELAQQIMGLYSTRAAKAGLHLESTVDDGVPQVVVGDPIRIRQILSNLLNNAISYTKAGTVRMRLAPVDREADPPTFRLSVADTGPGISAAAQTTIFQRFQRGDDVDAPGHGLGLAICRGLAELMGGTMGLDSTVGRGSTFWVDLPLGVAEVLPPEDSVTLPLPEQPIRALVVEDDRFNQTVARRLLERAGCEVVVAENGREGLAALAASPPDIVFMDVQMPVMNGLDAARQIRADEPEGSHLPIVGLTASSVAGARRRCIEAGMDGYLQKPVRLTSIVAALVEHLPDHYA